MALKIFRAVWFISVLALFARLIYGYAGWSEELIIMDEGSQTAIGRDLLFYILVAVIVLVNVMVYLVGKIYASNEDLRTWTHGLVITINLFLIIAISLVGLYNGEERYDFHRIGFIIYGSVALIVLWASVWPGYLLYRKFFVKQAV